MKHKGIVVASALVLLAGSVQAADSYVATTGSDTNLGSLAEPFATIQKAADTAGPGDTVYIRGGRYHEEVDLSGVAGTPGNPITLTCYPNEEVVLDGTVPITSGWAQDAGHVYKTTLTEDITQLFVDDKLMTLARFPNAPAFSDLAWDRRASRRVQESSGSFNGHVIDDPYAGAVDTLAGAGVSFNGCLANLNFGGNNTYIREVLNHVAGSDSFDYSPETDQYRGNDSYYFSGGIGNAERVMLDSAEEWAYDETTKTLYLWADDGQNPDGREISGKTRTYLLTGDATTRHMVIDGLNFFAGAFFFASSDNITIQNCNFNYYAASRRAVGDGSNALSARFEGLKGDYCVDITIYNCEFRFADANALSGQYLENMRVENNLFNQIGTTFSSGSSTCPFGHTKDLVYRRNTVDTSGFSFAFNANIRGQGGEPTRPIVFEYNFITASGLLSGDRSAVYISGSDIRESVIRNNWCIANDFRAYRWDGSAGGPLGNLYRNVALGKKSQEVPGAPGSSGYRLKGDDHEIYNNIGVNEWASLNVPNSKGTNILNRSTVTRNNAADLFTDDPIPGTNSHNFIGQYEPKTMKELLRDPYNWDFRPRADAIELVDQGIAVTCTVNGVAVDVTAGFNGSAPDIGAYEFGDPVYWIPGRQLPQASIPIPPDGAQHIKFDADLIYLIGLDGVAANIYFGSSSNDLPFLTSQTHPTNVVVPADHAVELAGDTTYYWRADTVLADSSVVTGEVWSFTTEPDFAYWRFENNLLDSGPNGFNLTTNRSAGLTPLTAAGAGSGIPATVPQTGDTNTYLGDLAQHAKNYFEHADDPWFDFGTDNVTLEAFIVPATDGSEGQTVIEKAASIILQISAGSDEMILGLSTGSYVNATWSPPGGFETGKVYYVAATIEPGALNSGADTRVNLYCKNLSDAASLEESGALVLPGVSTFRNSIKSLYVGGRGTSIRKAVAYIDEARITKRVLAESELLIADADYGTWAARFPGTDLSDPGADYDYDGLVNNEERIWGLDPASGWSPGPITLSLDLGAGMFTYTRRATDWSGISYTVWTSSDLQTWTEDTGAIQIARAPFEEVETVTVILSPELLTDTMLFVRVHAAE